MGSGQWLGVVVNGFIAEGGTVYVKVEAKDGQDQVLGQGKLEPRAFPGNGLKVGRQEAGRGNQLRVDGEVAGDQRYLWADYVSRGCLPVIQYLHECALRLLLSRTLERTLAVP